jgi:hypothetical protein
MPDEKKPDAAPSGTPAPGAPPAAPPPEPFAIFQDADAFNKRVDREARKRLRELGIEDPDATKAELEAAARLKAEAEERRKASLSEVERAKAEAAEAKAKLATVEQERDADRYRAKVTRLAAERGIKNLDYAYWALANDQSDQEEGAVLDALLAQPSQRAALGLVEPPAPPAPPTPTPANTAPGVTAPPAPPAPGTPPPGKTAFDMTPDEWAKKRAALGL